MGAGAQEGGEGSEPRRAALARLGKVCGAKLLRLAEQDGERMICGRSFQREKPLLFALTERSRNKNNTAFQLFPFNTGEMRL